MKERVAIVGGVRTPLCKAGEALRELEADDLGAFAVKELLARTAFPAQRIDEVILGNVAQPVGSANIARVVALKAGLPLGIPACTVHRNCASGMESITTAATRILAGEADVILAGGTESMSNIPLLYSKAAVELFAAMFKAKTAMAKLRVLLRFRLKHLAPIIGVNEGLTDPICSMNMGQTAEVLSREFHITRAEQDAFALQSHQRAAAAMKSGRFAEEIVPVPLPRAYDKFQTEDSGPRANQTLEALAKLKPFFDRHTGTVTVGNACPITDGAAALLVMREGKAREFGVQPLGYLRAYAYAGLEGRRMGLGPVYATAKLLRQSGLNLKDFSLVELNEAFAAQVIANERAFASAEFARQHLGQDHAVGEIARDILNVNGGAIALGHPVGTSGTRLVITILKELRHRNKNLGLATLCIGGGQGAALALEVA